MVEAAAETPEARRKWGLPDRLPPLSGWALVAYRILWCAAALLALASLAVSYRSQVEAQAAARAYYELGLRPLRLNTGTVVRPFSPQAKRLFGESEVVIAVNGRPMPLDREGEARLLAGPDGAQVSIDLRRADGSRHRLALTRSSEYLAAASAGTGISFEASRWIAFGFDLMTSLLWLATGLVLFLRRSADPVAALIATGAVLVPCDLVALWPSVPPLASATLGFLVNVLLITAFVAFPDGRFRPSWSGVVPILMVAVFVWALSNPPGIWPELAGGAVLVASLAAILIRYRTTPAGTTKQQIKLAIFGLVVGFVFVLISVACNAAYQSVESESARAGWQLLRDLFVSLGNMAIAGGLLGSLLRYRLYDADATISRSVAYGTLTVALLAIFAGTEKVIELLGEEYLGESLGALAGGIGAALAAVMIVPLHHRVSHWAEKRFRKQLIRLRHGLPLLVGDLRETAGLERIAAASLDAVTAGVRASRAALLVGDALAGAREVAPDAIEAWRAGWTPAAHDGLDCARGDPLFPMRVPLEADGHGRVGWLLLGPRPDGSFYGKDEREALAEIADPLARALQIVRTREQREAERKKETSLLRRAIAALSRRMAALEERSAPRASKSRA